MMLLRIVWLSVTVSLTVAATVKVQMQSAPSIKRTTALKNSSIATDFTASTPRTKDSTHFDSEPVMARMLAVKSTTTVSSIAMGNSSTLTVGEANKTVAPVINDIVPTSSVSVDLVNVTSTPTSSITMLLNSEPQNKFDNATIWATLNESSTTPIESETTPLASTVTEDASNVTAPTIQELFTEFTTTTPVTEESAATLKEALKCSVPHFVETSEVVNALRFEGNDSILSVSFGVQYLTIKWILPAAECFDYLTGLWIRIDDAVDYSTRSDAPWMVRKECLQRNGNQLTVTMLAQSAGDSCSFQLPRLIECRPYSVKVVPDFLSLKGSVSEKRFIVPPKGIGSALEQFQSSASSSGLNASWIMRSQDCTNILTSVKLLIYEDAMDNLASSLSLPKSCLSEDSSHGTSISLPSAGCEIPWQPLDKCRRYRMRFEAEFASQWQSEASSWDVFTAESGAQVSSNQSRCSNNQLFCWNQHRNWWGGYNEYSHCMHRDYICNGNGDYYSGYDYCDERHCVYNSDCSGKFHCGRRCIPSDLLCNGERDCEDGSDEEGCGSCCHLLSSSSASFPPDTRQRAAPCTYSISVDANLVVWLSFSHFESANPISVYDGPYSTSSLVFHKSGKSGQRFEKLIATTSEPTTSNQTHYFHLNDYEDNWQKTSEYERTTSYSASTNVLVPNSIRSTGNNLFVELPAGSRIRAYYTTIDINGPYHSFSNGCGGYIKDEGLITSPTETSGFECWWYIETSNPNTLVLNNYDPDQMSYSMTVYDGWTDGVVVSEQVNESAGKANVYSLSNRMRVQFKSSSSNPSYQWNVTNIHTPKCWSQFSQPSGTISSPDYPRSYPDNVDCRWQITAEPGSRIRLLFAYFSLENNFDFLQVHDGSSVYSPLLLLASGSIAPLQTVTSSSNSMLIRFNSNHMGSSYGFLAIYSTF